MHLRLQGLTYKKIAEALGKSKSTIESWFCEDERFKKEFQKLKDETIEQARNILINFAPEAAKHLISIAKGERLGRGVKNMLDANIDILDRVGLKPVEKQEIEHSTDPEKPVKFIAEWGSTGNESSQD